MTSYEYKKFQFITLVHTSLMHRVQILSLTNKEVPERCKLGYVEGWMGDAFRAADRMPDTLTTQDIIEASFDFVEFHWQLDEEKTAPLSWFLES